MLPKVSRRGVVFFRAQNDMTVELQKELAQRMGLLTGKPPSSGLHIFPLMHTTKQIDDKEVTVISDQGGKAKDSKEAASKPRLRLQDPSVSAIGAKAIAQVHHPKVAYRYRCTYKEFLSSAMR